MNSKSALFALAAAMVFAGTGGAAASTPLLPPEPVPVQQYGFLTEYQLPLAYKPWGIVAGAEGDVYVTLDGPGQIGRFRVATATIERYQLPERIRPFLLSRSARGELWFTDFEMVANPPPARLWRLEPKTGAWEPVVLPNLKAGPAMIAFAPKGEVYFTQMLANRTARLAGGTMVEELEALAAPANRQAAPVGLTFDSKGRLWVAESGADRVVMYERGKPKAYALPKGFWGPTDVKEGPGGQIWVSGHATNLMAALEPASGAVTLWPLHPPVDERKSPVARPSGIAVDGKGQIWVAEHEGHRIARILPAEHLVIEYPIPGSNREDPLAQWLTVDQGGNVWYAAWGTSRIGRIDAGAPYWQVAVQPAGEQPPGGSGVTMALSPGAQVAGTARATPQAGAAGNVEWELAGAPEGVTADFTPNPDGSVSFRIQTSRQTPPGAHRVLLGVKTPNVLSAQVVTLQVVRPLFGIPGLTWTPIAIGGGAMLLAAALSSVLRKRKV